VKLWVGFARPQSATQTAADQALTDPSASMLSWPEPESSAARICCKFGRRWFKQSHRRSARGTSHTVRAPRCRQIESGGYRLIVSSLTLFPDLPGWRPTV
jgi:hypothetical protein